MLKFNFVLILDTHYHGNHYKVNLVWTGIKGSGTTDYRSYDRDFVISIDGKLQIAGSSDLAFMGDKT